jgi:phage-related protein
MKRLFWLASAKKDLKAMPDDVQDMFGYALHLAQTGKKHEQAKPLKGFGSAGVLEVVENSGGGTFRAVKRATPKKHIDYFMDDFQESRFERHGVMRCLDGYF